MSSQTIRTELLDSASLEARSMDERILIVLADSLISTGFSAGIGAFLVALGFWAVFYFQTRQTAVLVWAVLIHSLQGLRYINNLHYTRIPLAQRNPVLSANRYCSLLIVTTTVWGLAPWMFFPKDNLPLTSLMMLVLLGMSSGGLASVAPYRRGIYFLTVPMLAGLATAMVWHGDGVHWFLAICTLAYLYVTIRFGLQQNELLTESLRARFEKEDIAQRLAEQVEMVKRASLEKTRFLASASHDLRQPLHSIGLFGAALFERCKSTPDEPLVRNLMLCIDALEESFTAMLDVSKLDAGVIEPKSQPVSLAHLFRRLETSFGRQAETQGLALRFKPGGKWTYGDPVLLERLLGNLVHNSLKFTPHGGVVIVARTRGQRASIEVWDSGIGIEANELPRIFDEFYQLGNPERDRSKGLGMGLSIVKRLSILLDIPLTVYSRVGHGTVFKLLMPLIEAEHEQVFLPSQINLKLTGRRILVVDDEENVRNSTAVALRLHGLNVETAEGLEQALAIASRLNQHLDAVITDLRLRQGENGILLAAELNARLGRKLPTLLVTGDIAPDRMQLAQLSGLRVLYKPVNIDELLAALRELLT